LKVKFFGKKFGIWQNLPNFVRNSDNGFATTGKIAVNQRNKQSELKVEYAKKKRQ